MTRSSSFPYVSRRVRSHTHLALSAVACLFVSGLCAGVAEAQTKAMRPVARLIGSSRGESGAYERAEEACRQPNARIIPASMTNTSDISRPRTARVVASDMEQRAFQLINAERRARGESLLVWDAELTRMARDHSDNMAQQNFFDHTDPRGQNTMTRARASGICGWSALAENIAYNAGYEDPAGFAVERWLVSPKHRDNILREGFTHSGIGAARSADGRVYFTQVFVTR